MTPQPKQARSLSASADSTEDGAGDDALTPEALQQIARPFQKGVAEAETAPAAAKKQRRAGSQQAAKYLYPCGALRTATAASVADAQAQKEHFDGVARAKEALLRARRQALQSARNTFLLDNLALQAARQRLDEEEASRTASSSSSSSSSSSNSSRSVPGASAVAKVQSKLSFLSKSQKSTAACIAAAATPQRSRSSSSLPHSAVEALKTARAQQAISASALREADLEAILAEAALQEALDATREASLELAQSEALLASKGAFLSAARTIPAVGADLDERDD